MSDQYIGEIRMFAGNYAPVGWMLCQGQILPIDQNAALFQLIGTTYGGDGQQTFALPNLSSRVPLHPGSGFILGQTGGSETVTLNTQQIPSHSHTPTCDNNPGSAADPTGAVWAGEAGTGYAVGTAANANPNAGVIGRTGGSQPHDNMIPYLAINFIIALNGIFPSQS
jgi:microcystin-dependent protein